MITEQKVIQAIKVLTDHDGDYSKTRAGHEFSKGMEKIVLAQLMQDSDEKSAAAKKIEAEAHEDYKRALEQTRDIAEMDYKNRAQREAAAAIIDTWRTEQSNERAHTSVPTRRAG